MSSEFLVRIPLERVAVLIGPQGSVKQHIEELTDCKLNIDSNTGDVIILADELSELSDPVNLWKARDIVKAIGRGFNPNKAYKIIEADQVFQLISLRDEIGDSPNTQKLVRARVIGKKGRTRNFIEQATKTFISVYGNTIGIIGEFKMVDITRTAILRLIRGSKHGSVYSFIEQQVRDLTDDSTRMWAEGTETDLANITDLDELERIVFEEEKGDE